MVGNDCRFFWQKIALSRRAVSVWMRPYKRRPAFLNELVQAGQTALWQALAILGSRVGHSIGQTGAREEQEKQTCACLSCSAGGYITLWLDLFSSYLYFSLGWKSAPEIIPIAAGSKSLTPDGLPRILPEKIAERRRQEMWAATTEVAILSYSRHHSAPGKACFWRARIRAFVDPGDACRPLCCS